MEKHGNPVPVKEQLLRKYDNAEFTLATAITDYDTRANEADMFKFLLAWTTVVIRSNKAISVKINAATNPSISISANLPFELDNLIEITNIFITNASGDTASIKIFGCRKGADRGQEDDSSRS